jgi:pyrroloquinoline quinone biosynthesis protein B
MYHFLKAATILFFLLLVGSETSSQNSKNIYILGTAQDGGYPHAGCTKKCCAPAWQDDSLVKYVVSFALVDSAAKKWWLFEATPDIKFQLNLFNNLTHGFYNYLPDGVFITHAHIGHYTGLMQFGKEVLHTKAIPVYVLPRMKTFLEQNGPWSQLVSLGNISLQSLNPNSVLIISEKIKVETVLVPHRYEFSETAGFKIFAGTKKYLFIPDIDKWENWNTSIADEVKSADVSLLDGTFYVSDELPGRKISDVPHPLVLETMELFKNEPETIKNKIFFIHLNHTNPLLWDSGQKQKLIQAGFRVAEQGSSY